MIIFIPGTSAARSLWVEWLPIGPLITSVAAATPGSFSFSLSPPLQLQNLLPFITTPSSVRPSLSLYTFTHCVHSTVGNTFIIFGLFLCYNTFIISTSSFPSLSHYTFTPLPLQNLALWLQPADGTFLRTKAFLLLFLLQHLKAWEHALYCCKSVKLSVYVYRMHCHI